MQVQKKLQCLWVVLFGTLVIAGCSSTATEPVVEQQPVTEIAEVVEVDYDPDKITYVELLDTFWAVHDPTTLNRQGPDVGTQYRSAIYFHTSEQQEEARNSLLSQSESGKYRNPIVTEITQASTFYKAEEYHQRYFEKHGRH